MLQRITGNGGQEARGEEELATDEGLGRWSSRRRGLAAAATEGRSGKDADVALRQRRQAPKGFGA